MEFIEHPLAIRDLERLPPKAAKRFVDRRFKIIEENDFTDLLRTKIIWPVSGYDLFEAKIRIQKMRFRALGCVIKAKFWLLHVFHKKSRKISRRNMETASIRMKQIMGVEKEIQIQKQL